MILPDVGLQGQRTLRDASVLVIGTGGLGSPASLYLAAAGVGRIGLVDFDKVDLSNLHRQIVHDTGSIGEPKVLSAQRRIQRLNPEIEVTKHAEAFSSETALRLIESYDVVVDGSDNLATRYLSNDACVLTGKPNIYGAVAQYEGQITVFDARVGPCYRCLFPVPPPPEAVLSCTETGVLGVLPGVIGTMQAAEALKILLGIGAPLAGTLLVYDLLDQSWMRIEISKHPQCAVCGPHPTITSLIDYDESCGGPAPQGISDLGDEWEISARELKARLDQGEDIRILDVRERGEWALVHLDGSRCVPLAELSGAMDTIPRDVDLCLVCRAGVRSAHALQLLRDAGYTRLKNLRGGILAWAKDVDPTIPTY
jgi:sulfur-carrier protein adenylyltransferase/sulfurtransferase